MNQTKLRRQFDEWAAPLRAAPPPPFESIRRRARIRLGRIAAAAGSAAAVIALAVGLAVTSLGGAARPLGPGPWGSGPYPAPPAQPYVFVSFSLGPTAQIRNAESGAVLATLRPPAQTTTFGVAAASATDRLFVVAENPAGGTVTFATIRLTGAGGGTPSVHLAAVPHVVLPNGTQVTDLVVNQAGSRFALISQAPDGKNALSIYNLASGTLIGRWPAGSVQLTSPLAFLPNGSLAVVWVAGGPAGTKTNVQVNGSAAIEGHTAGASPTPSFDLVNRIINPAVPFRAGSSLYSDSRPDTALHRRIGTLTADGNLSLSLVQGSAADLQFVQSGSAAKPGGGPIGIAEFSSATGKLVHLIPIGPASALDAPHYCGVVWASADGSDLLTQCGTTQQEVVGGKVTGVRLAWIFPTSGVPSVSPFAW